MTEGGTRVPAIINQKGKGVAGSISAEYTTVMDIAPTLLELARLTPPGTSYRQRPVYEMHGTSFASLLSDPASEVHADSEPIAWELIGRRAAKRGRWKLLWLELPHGKSEWELFDIRADPGETKDLSGEYPEIRDSLIADWEEYAERNGVILRDRPPPY